MELLLTALVIGFVVWFFPVILTFIITLAAIIFCLIMSAVTWFKSLFTPKKPTR